MAQQYEALTNTEKYFIVILLIIYMALLVTTLLIMGTHPPPCRLEIDKNCGLWQYFLGIAPFYTSMFTLNTAIVLSAYYLNKLSIKSVKFFRLLTLPPFLLLIYYFYNYGDELAKTLAV
ncbi:MAG: hypothetical protein WBP13_01735 [Methylophilaceae bacterium]